MVVARASGTLTHGIEFEAKQVFDFRIEPGGGARLWCAALVRRSSSAPVWCAILVCTLVRQKQILI